MGSHRPQLFLCLASWREGAISLANSYQREADRLCMITFLTTRHIYCEWSQWLLMTNCVCVKIIFRTPLNRADLGLMMDKRVSVGNREGSPQVRSYRVIARYQSQSLIYLGLTVLKVHLVPKNSTHKCVC